jgi:transposase-like protein
VDETYIKIKKEWYYLYRAVDSTGATLDFMLSATRDADAAEQFFRKVLNARHTTLPRVITVDQNAAYPPAFEALQRNSTLPETCLLRQCKYLNNVVEQDHRFVKRRVNPGLGFGAFQTAQRTIHGYEGHPYAAQRPNRGPCEERCPCTEPRDQPAVRAGRLYSACLASPQARISFCNTTPRLC